ncbi:MAG: cysteine desulfurase family protein [Dehalococcoidia bacterium]
MKNEQIYLDHAATTPLRKEVLDSMMPFLETDFGNPSALYQQGQIARKAVDESRELMGEILRARVGEIVITSGGTESDNAAIKSSALAMRNFGNHIITSQIEHEAVLNSCEQLVDFGFDITFLPVDSQGFINTEDLIKEIRSETVLISLMMANNEIGTIQPIKDISQKIKLESQKIGHQIIFHTDAVQCVGSLDVDFRDLEVDLLSLSAHKFQGPRGVGALLIKRNTPFLPLMTGGGQERDRRSGTENVAGIVGMAKALQLSNLNKDLVNKNLIVLRDRIIKGVLNSVEGSVLNGHPTQRLPNNANFSFESVEGEPILLGLDFAGISASSGSACSASVNKPSHVLLAIGRSNELAQSALRITLGPSNTEEEVEYFLKTLPEIINKLKSMPSLQKS